MLKLTVGKPLTQSKEAWSFKVGKTVIKFPKNECEYYQDEKALYVPYALARRLKLIQ
jgi:hypothetical protein